MILIKNIRLTIEEKEDTLRYKTARKLGIDPGSFRSFRIAHKSLDARKEPFFNYQVIVELTNEKRFLKRNDITEYFPLDLGVPKVNTSIRPIVIGLGPSGLFCAYRLLAAGIRPIVIERGSRIVKREKAVELFTDKGILDPASTVQYGEGGAGTCSDAKLTTRIKDPLISYIIDALIAFGADESIAYESHPHIGTDRIRNIITKMTDWMISEGADCYFDEKVTDFLVENRQITGVVTNNNRFASPIVIAAFGHSAYDTFTALHQKGVYLENKDISIGFRVEHPQKMIDLNQYGPKAAAKLNIPAEYFLRAKTTSGKGVYSFCMCPGGYVMPSSSDIGGIVTNGMSFSDRGNDLANSAILATINQSDYGNDLFSGFNYIHSIEKNAYLITNSYQAPAQNIKDYLKSQTNELIFPSSYSLGTVNYNLNYLFSDKINAAFHEAIEYFDHLIPGFIDHGIMVAPETRSSCPLRIKRQPNGISINTGGLYPIGEGAGYAGGIMSSALDGIKAADKIIALLG